MNYYQYPPITPPYAQQQGFNQFAPYQAQQPAVQSTIQQNTPILRGRFVGSRAEVEAMSVEPDGSVTYFPQLDGKEIYGKYIDRDGSAHIVSYVPQTQQLRQPDIQEQMNALSAKMDSIYKKLESMSGEGAVANEPQ